VIVAARRAATPATARGHDFSADAANQFFQHAVLFSEERVPAEQILHHVRERWGEWRMLASHYIFEDLFWQRRTKAIPWLEALIRL
jgi:hypothetical protein